jgi:DNA-binding response OmpR family regulator
VPKKPQPRTILVVDDQKSHREFTRSVLQEEGYTIFEAQDYWEAVNIHGHVGKIDLLLTAIALPGTNGYELAKTIFGRDPYAKVLFVSGPTGAEVSRFYNMPVTGSHILTKPVQIEELKARVRAILRSRHQAWLSNRA